MTVIPFPTGTLFRLTNGQQARPLICIVSPDGLVSASLIPSTCHLIDKLRSAGVMATLTIGVDVARRLFESDAGFTHFVLIDGRYFRNVGAYSALAMTCRNRLHEAPCVDTENGNVFGTVWSRDGYAQHTREVCSRSY